MTRRLLMLAASATLSEAASLMAQRHVGSVLVMDGDRLDGILTERDIVRAVSTDVHAPREPIRDWYSARPRTITPDADVETARGMMLEGHFRHLPVVEKGRVVGMLSMRDLARAAAEKSAGQRVTL